MPNLFFPQLTSGASAQYPIGKTRIVRTVKNVLADGSMLVFADPTSARLHWQLSYANLSLADTTALQSHFDACAGPARAFTFIDPTDNMLVGSANLAAAPWQTSSSLVHVAPDAVGPDGSSAAFTVTNNAAVPEEITQTLLVPAGYQYCFSIYAASVSATTITLARRNAVEETTTGDIGPAWTRIVSSGRLLDNGIAFTVAISLLAGQRVLLYGPQLEAQIAPSRYRPTGATGGVYAAAHWAVNELAITAQAPNLFSTSFSIETSL